MKKWKLEIEKRKRYLNMFIVYWIMSAMFGIVASVDGSLYGVWFLCCLGCFVLGLINLIKGGYKK